VFENFLGRLEMIRPDEFDRFSMPPTPDVTNFNLPPLLQEALASRKNLFIRYVDQKGRETERLITPKQIMVAQDYIYVSALCHLRNEERSFRLDRITEMEPGDE